MTDPVRPQPPSSPVRTPNRRQRTHRMLVSEILSRRAALTPDHPAVWYRDRWYTYGELDRDSNALAHFLRGIGLAPGQHVAILLENSADYVTAHFGALKAGAVEISLNTELKGEGLRRLIEHGEVSILIASHRLYQRWHREFARLPRLRHVILDDVPGELPAAGEDAPAIHALRTAIQSGNTSPVTPGRIDLDLACIVYTSGSTGDAKGVMLSHLNLVSNMRSIVDYLGLRPDDRMMVVLPFHYIYGRSLLYTHLLSGGSILLDNRFAFPAKILETMEHQAATCFAGVPSTFSILLHKTDLRQRRMPSLRLVTQAGGGMAPAMQREVAEAVAPARLCVMYGSTEAAPRLSYVDPEALPRKWGSIGRAIPNVEIAVLDANGARLPHGATGEIAARGSNIMMGYWKDPDGTARVLRHGYYYTGDLGYADDEGYFFLTGRSQDMFKVAGNRVSAKEVEDALVSVPGVIEAAAIAVPDEILGEAIKAFVAVKADGPGARDLAQALGHNLPPYKVPKHFVFVEALPKNANGKVDKAALRAGDR